MLYYFSCKRLFWLREWAVGWENILKTTPSACFSVNGKTLAERALDALGEAGIKKCIFVVGYKKDNVMAALGTRHKDIEISYTSNDVYDKTNNIYSLYLAKDFLLQDDTILLESDLIFENALIRDMVQSPEPTLAAVAAYESWMDGTVVKLAPDSDTIAAFIPKKLYVPFFGRIVCGFCRFKYVVRRLTESHSRRNAHAIPEYGDRKKFEQKLRHTGTQAGSACFE
ncbi:MAG: hypothetical protein Ta2A_03310 [Treponemataceae bacterium]|nr:MAG: hypothetical protein Ta2A_03310 [Treponemataceae bacterium]